MSPIPCIPRWCRMSSPPISTPFKCMDPYCNVHLWYMIVSYIYKRFPNLRSSFLTLTTVFTKSHAQSGTCATKNRQGLRSQNRDSSGDLGCPDAFYVFDWITHVRFARQKSAVHWHKARQPCMSTWGLRVRSTVWWLSPGSVRKRGFGLMRNCVHDSLRTLRTSRC